MMFHRAVVSCLVVLGMAGVAFAVEGVEGTTVRPKMEAAKVEGCKVAAPGKYEVSVGDLIELDYSYPVVPTAMPRKVLASQARVGAVIPSPFGVRQVTTPRMVGMSTIAFYFDAKKAGNEVVRVSIDGDVYAYQFTVKEE